MAFADSINWELLLSNYSSSKKDWSVLYVVDFQGKRKRSNKNFAWDEFTASLKK